MIEKDRVISPIKRVDEQVDSGIRPLSLMITTDRKPLVTKSRLRLMLLENVVRLGSYAYFWAARPRKNNAARIIANEMGAQYRQTSGPILDKAGDLAAILTNLGPNDVLFIDEIHRMSPTIEEILYPAMEDQQLDIMIGEGPAARSIKVICRPLL